MGKPSGGSSGRADLYGQVTQRIIAELKAGRVPWVKPWGSDGGADAALPRNAITGRCYSGINILILWGAVIEHRWPAQGWLTFRQALNAGGSVKRGERGTTVVYADTFTPKGEAARAARDGDAARAVPFLKSFTVFNVAQCEGLRPGFGIDPPPLAAHEISPVAEAVIAASGVEYLIGGSEAFYVPSKDYVRVPPLPAFVSAEDYYCTSLHELVHATGHPKRLNRASLTASGTKDYGREELVAEMGSAFLCAALGIEPTVRHADYLGTWLAILKEDHRAIFRAASQASRAADWLLARYDAAQVAERRLAA
ncbi:MULTISPECIES: ArdC family protein [unclassified Sphingopyxis]|uniref:ArdC family protein n=1 Tax=unclassified Sphingopyxis TaxID=2614943 RepID=UPI0009E6B798|nr:MULTISPECIES: zincin-like metallopeptidase domain-containing protein [unclassified Sphingopyxis]